MTKLVLWKFTKPPKVESPKLTTEVKLPKPQ